MPKHASFAITTDQTWRLQRVRQKLERPLGFPNTEASSNPSRASHAPWPRTGRPTLVEVYPTRVSVVPVTPDTDTAHGARRVN